MARPGVDAVREELWGRARAGDSGDLARLADREGVGGLVERGSAEDKGGGETSEGKPAKAGGETKEPGDGHVDSAKVALASTRMTAIRAMAFAPEPGALAGLPFLAEAARGPDDAQAQAALESAIDLAARPRRAVDPEDAAEMKAGCDSMLALARESEGSTPPAA